MYIKTLVKNCTTNRNQELIVPYILCDPIRSVLMSYWRINAERDTRLIIAACHAIFQAALHLSRSTRADKLLLT